MVFDENGEYIVKARDANLTTNNKKQQNKVLILEIILSILSICSGLKYNQIIVGILFCIFINILMIFNFRERGLEIKNRKVYIQLWFKKFEIDFCDLVKVKKRRVQSDSENRMYRNDSYYLEIQYLKDNKIKELQYGYTTKLDETIIDDICALFLTNKQIERNLDRTFEEFVDIRNKEKENDIQKEVNNKDKMEKIYFIILIIAIIVIILITGIVTR